MTPTEIYLHRIATGELKQDARQARALVILDELQAELIDRQQQSWWRQWLPGQRPTPQGIYFWGGVGIGKTMLMDLFFESLPSPRKRRLHFHRFMQQVHNDLQRLQGQADPLKHVARHFSLQADVLCLDEFLVHDIADAMLLANLLEALHERGVVLVTTANLPPKDLYKNGLQRARFLPAIAHLQTHSHVVHIDSSHDYRWQSLQEEGVFFIPSGPIADTHLQHCFDLYKNGDDVKHTPLTIASRQIATRQHTNNIVWFDFHAICAVPRSQRDYLAIAKQYQAIIVSNIPKLDDTAAIYFIHLIDVLYDEHRLLFLSADVPLDQLYTSGPHQEVFARTLSRLQEMQSGGYW